MSYYITAFDGLTLPTAKPLDDISSDDSVDMGMRVAGGSYYDGMGTDRSNAKLHPIRVKRLLTAASAAALTTAYDAIKAKRGKYGTVTMTPGGGTVTRTRMGRMMDVRADNEPGQITFTPIELTIMPTTEGWSGTANSVTATLDAYPTPTSIGCTNNGNKRNAGAIITLSVPAGGSALTGLNVYVTGVSYFSYGGTVAANTALVIDCGAHTVLNDGSDARSGLTLHATNHKISDWLRLEPGANTVVVSHTDAGTATTVNFAYNELFE